MPGFYGQGGLTAQQTADLALAATALQPSAYPFTAVQSGQTNQQVYEVYAAYPGQAYTVKGFITNPGHSGAIASTANKVRGKRNVAPSTANNALDGTAIGGFNVETTNRLFYFSATSVWTTYHFVSSTSLTTFRGAACMATSNPADSDAVATNSLGVRLRPASNAAFFAYATNATPATATGTTGVTPAADTNYVIRISWDGTTASVSIATISAVGVVGSYSTPVTFTGSQLPTSTVAMTPTQKWWNHGATQPTLDIGGAQVVPGPL